MDSGAGGTTFGSNREDAVGISGGIGVDTVNNKVIMTSPAGNTVYSFDSGSGASYYSSGTFESASIDLGAAANFNKLLWNPTSEPTNTSITVQAASSASSGGPWSYINLNNVTGSGGDIPASLNNNRYFRYKVTLATTNVSATPSLNDMTLNYSGGGNVYTPDTSAEVAVSPAAIHHYTVSATPGQHAGAGWTETVTAYDQYNNICTNNSSAQVTMTNDGAAQFFTDANYNIQQPLNKYPLSNGTVTIYIRDNTTQTIAITATDGNNKTGTSAGILVSPATTSQYSLNNVVSIIPGVSAIPMV